MLSLLITSLLVATASAFPFAPFPPRAVPQGCSLAGLTIPTVAGLSLPSGQKLSAVTVGRGTQNYTCTAGKYVSAGAVADLYDVSCVFAATKPFVDSKVVSDLLPEIALKALSYPNAKLPVTIKHYFSTTPNSTAGAISPVFATAKDKVLLSRTAGVDAPAPATDVASLQLSAVAGQGTLAKSVFRLDTASGQPPASCTTEGEKIQVNYGAMYYFTK